MKRVDEEFLPALAESTCSDTALGNSISGPASYGKELHIEDHRVAQLLVLLQQLNESTGGLAALPAPELSEVVLSAVRLCGFVDESEALDVFAAVLEAIEMPEPIPEAPKFCLDLAPQD